MEGQSWVEQLDGGWSEKHIHYRLRLAIVAGIALAVSVGVFLAPRIHQNLAYNHFADTRTLLGIPNFYDVVSNFPFLVIGILGIVYLLGRKAPPGSFQTAAEKWPYLALFAGAILACFGSSYYHLAPSDGRLFWDRLPMTIVFMSLFAAVLSERISVRLGTAALFPLLALGIASVLYWHFTELRGSDDLRLYVEVQYLPVLAIPLICFLFPSRYTRGSTIFLVIGLYILAKVLEQLDAPIFSLGHLVSGHFLKHLTAAFSGIVFLDMFEKRKPRHGAGP
jgi:hypothetical protein